MSSYKDTILTQRGSSIASDAAKGKLQFTITRTVASNADFSSYNDDGLAALTKLPNEIQNGSIVDELDDTDQQGTTGTQVRFTNTNVKTAFKINAVGLYAKINGDDTEYLYSITLADSPYYMNDYSNKVYNQFDLIIYVVVGDKANLNLNINPDNFVSYGYLQKRLDLKADKADLKNIDVSGATKNANNYTDRMLIDYAKKTDLNNYQGKGDYASNDDLKQKIADNRTYIDKATEQLHNQINSDLKEKTNIPHIYNSVDEMNADNSNINAGDLCFVLGDDI